MRARPRPWSRRCVPAPAAQGSAGSAGGRYATGAAKLSEPELVPQTRCETEVGTHVGARPKETCVLASERAHTHARGLQSGAGADRETHQAHAAADVAAALGADRI